MILHDAGGSGMCCQVVTGWSQQAVAVVAVAAYGKDAVASYLEP